MKKALSTTLALVFAASVAGTGVAFAANPFVDVPAHNWAYSAVSQLAHDGIVDGYGDGTFRGDHTMTRYEMAVITAKAMAKESQANAADRALIDKLASEYSQELQNLGVRVSALESKVGNVKLSGEYRFRYNNQRGDLSNHQGQNYLELDARAQVNSDWTVGARFESYRNAYNDKGFNGSNNGANQNDNGQFDATQLYVTGPVAGATVTAGKFFANPGSGMTFSDDATGATIQAGNALKVTLGTLATNNNTNYDTAGLQDNAKVNYAQLDYNFSKATSATASYQQWKTNGTVSSPAAGSYAATMHNTLAAAGYPNINIWDVTVNSKLSDKWSATGSYVKSNYATDNKAYRYGVQFLNADTAKAGSFDIFAGYESVQYMTTTDDDMCYINNAGEKGPYVGFHYVPAKNVKLTTYYYDAKAYADNNMGLSEGQHDKYFRSQVEFFF
jgi:hypothetical protein